MSYAIDTKSLSHQGALTMLAAGAAEAETIGQPQCIVIVDASGELIAELRMTGAKYLSRKSARTKARTAASIGAPSSNIPEGFGDLLSAATQNNVTRLPGGLPIRIDGVLVGGIGVGSGTGEQDIAVAQAALRAVGAEV